MVFQNESVSQFLYQEAMKRFPEHYKEQLKSKLETLEPLPNAELFSSAVEMIKEMEH